MLNASVRPGADELVMVADASCIAATIASVSGDYMILEVEGVRFEARAWRDGDGPWPMHPLEFPDARAWTVYGVIGHTKPATLQ